MPSSKKNHDLRPEEITRRVRAWKEFPATFAHDLLPQHCRLPFASVHDLVFAWHRQMGVEKLPTRRGLRYVLAAPRGAAKSTAVSLILPLHDIVFRRERYIVLLSATEAQARQRLKALRRELQHGPIARVFAPLLAQDELRFTSRSLVANGVQVDAFGAGTEVRGISARGWRPTKIILDDAEASRSADSATARLRLAEWYAEIVEYLGDTYTHLLAIGTVLHEKGLIASLLQRPDFTGHRARSVEAFSPREDLWSEWRTRLLNFADPDRRSTARAFFQQHRAAMEEGTCVLWPEKEDYEELMAQLTLQGRRAFLQEKQNAPLGAEDALFDPERALRAVYSGDDLLVQSAGTSVRTYPRARFTARRFAYLDSALGKGRARAQGDFSALAVVLLMPDDSLVLESLWARRASPTEQVARLFDQHEQTPLHIVAVEGTGFQELLMLPIEEERARRAAAGRRADLHVQIANPRRSKQARISALEPLLSSGTLALAPQLDEEFWEELACFPRCAHDDALDAAAGAVELALQHRGSTTASVEGPLRPVRTRGGF